MQFFPIQTLGFANPEVYKKVLVRLRKAWGIFQTFARSLQYRYKWPDLT